MPSPDLKARVLAAVGSEPAPTRPAVVRGGVLAACAAVALTLGIFLLMGGLREGDRPESFVVATAAGWFAIALVATLGVTRRGSMIGGSRAALFALMAGLPVALLAWYAVWLSRVPVASEPVPLARGGGCIALTLAMGAIPFIVFSRVRRDSDPVHPRVTGAAIGAVAGAWASVLIGLHCEQAELLHVAVGHVLPVALLAGIGAIVGGRVVGMHAEEARTPRVVTPRG